MKAKSMRFGALVLGWSLLFAWMLYKELTTPAWFLAVSPLWASFPLFFVLSALVALAFCLPEKGRSLRIAREVVWSAFAVGSAGLFVLLGSVAVSPNFELFQALYGTRHVVAAAEEWNSSSPVVLKYRRLIETARTNPAPSEGLALLTREQPWLDSLGQALGGREAVERARLYQTGIPSIDGDAIADAVRDGVWTREQDEAHHQALLDAVVAAPSGSAKDRLVAALGNVAQ